MTQAEWLSGHLVAGLCSNAGIPAAKGPEEIAACAWNTAVEWTPHNRSPHEVIVRRNGIAALDD